MAGIKETKELIVFVSSLGNALGNALEDGEIDWTDLGSLVGVIRTVGPALEGAQGVLGELSDLSEVEYQELLETAQESFDIPQDKLEEYAEAAFDLGLRLSMFVSKFFTEEESE